ncbi:MAG TPA: hypothetical protein VH144_02345 [Candidatus Saccharimonadales bacterium]|nr:hypothetical protein [Candidatus Saccharimonadales bacterium]
MIMLVLMQTGPDLTCRSPECSEATMTAQPYMTQEIFTEKVRAFFDEHPPKNGFITDDDHHKPLMTVADIIHT